MPQIRDELFTQIFGFCRMRKDLKANVHYILEHLIKSQKKFDYTYYLTKNCPLPNHD